MLPQVGITLWNQHCRSPHRVAFASNDDPWRFWLAISDVGPESTAEIAVADVGAQGPI